MVQLQPRSYCEQASLVPLIPWVLFAYRLSLVSFETTQCHASFPGCNQTSEQLHSPASQNGVCAHTYMHTPAQLKSPSRLKGTSTVTSLSIDTLQKAEKLKASSVMTTWLGFGRGSADNFRLWPST